MARRIAWGEGRGGGSPTRGRQRRLQVISGEGDDLGGRWHGQIALGDRGGGNNVLGWG
jgi:hypothetical protein